MGADLGEGSRARGFESFADLLRRRGRAELDTRPAPEVVGTTLANLLRIDETPSHHLEPAELDALIKSHGLPCEVRRVLPCPCARPDHPGSFPATCPDCAGSGRYYPEQLRVSPMSVLVNGASLQQQQQEPGQTQEGRVSLTFPTSWVPRPGDLVIPEGLRYSVAEQLVRAALDVNPYDLPGDDLDETLAPPRIAPAEDRLKHRAGVTLEAMTWRGAEGVAVLGRDGLDFDLRDDGRIAWRPLRGPAPGASFSVRYTAPVVYVVGVDVSPRSDSGIPLPTKASGIRLDTLGTRADP